MKKKNKAARTVNIALGLIVLLSVVLLSPLFGFGRGFSSAEQRQAASVRRSMTSSYQTALPEATPRPTPMPSPTPVVLPTAPPAPEPTQALTPRPAAAPAPAQQAQAETWTQDEYWEPEEEIYDQGDPEQSAEEAAEDAGASGAAEAQSGGQIAQGEGGLFIPDNGADLIINVPSADTAGDSAGAAAESTWENGGAASDSAWETGGEEYVIQQPALDRSEGEAFTIG